MIPFPEYPRPQLERKKDWLILNGEWNLKVVAGINEVNTVPAIDDTRGKIPVPGAGTCMGSANRDITVLTRSQVTITLC